MAVQKYLQKSGRRVRQLKNGNTLGDDWVSLFLKRHPSLSVRISQNVKLVRTSTTGETFQQYIAKLKESLDGVPLTHIYNFDESNLSDEFGRQKVIVKRGSKYPEVACNHSKVAYIIMICGNAAGELLPVCCL